MAVPGFIFGGDTNVSYEELQRRREIADAIIARSNKSPSNVGEGLSAIGQALGYRLETNRLNKAQAAGAKGADAAFNAALGGGAPSSSSPAGGALAAADARYTMGNTGREIAAKPSDAGIYDQFIGTVKEGGLTNPYGLAAVAATGQAESGFSPKNVYGEWSDPSESGQAGQAGGALSWRADRLESMRRFAQANGDDPARPSPATQAKFFLNEDPSLIAKLQGAGSAEEAQTLMNNAWRFAGYDRPGGEAGRRIASANAFLPRFNEDTNAVAAIERQAPVQVASADPSFMPSQPRLPEMGMEDVQRTQAAPRGPNTVPYNGPGQTIDPVTAQRLLAGPAAAPLNGMGVTSVEAPVRPDMQVVAGQDITPLAAMPAPQSVGANPVPPQGDPRQAVLDAMMAKDPSFDGFARNGGGPVPAGAPAIPAPPGQRQVADAMMSRNSLGVDPALLQAASNPYMSPERKAILNAMLQQQMKANAPMSQADQLGLEKTRLEIEQLRNPQLKPGDQLAREKFEFDRQQAGVVKPTSDIQEYEFAKQQGYQGNFVDFQLAQKKAGATSITTTVGGDTGDFYKEADKNRGKAVADIAAAGDTAQRSLIQIGELEKRLSTVGTGAVAGLKQIAGNFGIAVDGMDDIQAATALINQLVPGQRPPGSGTMSDADVLLFKQSLPRIINSEGGNEKIIGAMKGIAQYDVQRAQIANAVLNREISPAEGNARMNALPNPLAGLMAPPAAVSPAPAGNDPLGGLSDAELEAIANGG